jgi:hypothetical protein
MVVDDIQIMRTVENAEDIMLFRLKGYSAYEIEVKALYSAFNEQRNMSAFLRFNTPGAGKIIGRISC